MNPTTRRKSTAPTGISSGVPVKKDATRAKIERMEIEREERRQQMIQRKQARKKEHEDNVARGNPGDIDFIGMVRDWRKKNVPPTESINSHNDLLNSIAPPSSNSGNICIAVRKRPVSLKELDKADHDSVSVAPPKSITIHSAKFRVDGITKYLTHNTFHFDHSFGEDSTTTQLYIATTLPLVDHVLRTKGRATVFCYGQTGSGKTYTMNGIQQILAYDLYGEQRDEELEIHVAFFELYGGLVQDLLHDRKKCKLLEDGKGEVNITGLTEVAAPTPEDFLSIIEQGNGSRTTHTTEANDTSSRSHAICQVFLRDKQDGKLRGKLGLVDLAGSERGSDTKSHNQQRRAESAEINTSLLSLKECIRALGQKSTHVPYRGSKLTLILKDCFSPESKTTMITTVSPGASSADHSLNSLRYADRIKEQKSTTKKSRPSTGVGHNNRNLSSGLPSKERLERIIDAIGLADQHLNDSINDILAEGDAAISPTGLAVPNSKSFESRESSEEKAFSTPNSSLLLIDDDAVEVVKAKSPLKESISNNEAITEPILASAAKDTGSEIPASFEAVPSNESTETYSLAQKDEPTKEEEAELLHTVQNLFRMEDAILTTHLNNVNANAAMLTSEGELLSALSEGGASDDDMDKYALTLAEYLDKKEELIYKLRATVVEFKKELAREQQLSQRVKKLTTY